jgi:hypothetical protein
LSLLFHIFVDLADLLTVYRRPRATADFEMATHMLEPRAAVRDSVNI